MEIYDGQGREYEAEVAALEPGGARLRILTETRSRSESPLAITLGLGLARSETFDLVVRQATEMGVTRLIPFFCQRSLVKPASRGDFRQQRWQRLARQTLKSCQRQLVPQIDSPQSFAAVLQGDEAMKIMFWEEKRAASPENLLQVRPTPDSVRVLIGPEGGFSVEEAEQAQEAGFALLGLGPRRLKVETAALTALAIIQYAWGDLAG